MLLFTIIAKTRNVRYGEVQFRKRRTIRFYAENGRFGKWDEKLADELTLIAYEQLAYAKGV